jgi:hypothetical protein
MVRHQGGDDPALAYLTPYPGFDMARRKEGYAPMIFHVVLFL